MSASSSVDPVSIWLRSQIIDRNENESAAADNIARTNVAARYHGQRSAVWTSLSEMTGPNRRGFITKMVKNWPFAKEKYAMLLPMHAGALSTCICTSIVACKINADSFFMNPKMGFLETVRLAPKSPFVIPIYASGLCFFGFYNTFVFGQFMEEDNPCPSCALTRFAAIMVLTGTLFPAATAPALAHYVNIQRNPNIPQTKNMLEFLTMITTVSKPCWQILPKLAVIQLIVAAGGTYSLLWGRERIFTSVEMDPEMFKTTLTAAQSQSSFKAKAQKWLSRFPFLRPFLDVTDEEDI